jgi:hypothetical protein
MINMSPFCSFFTVHIKKGAEICCLTSPYLSICWHITNPKQNIFIKLDKRGILQKLVNIFSFV